MHGLSVGPRSNLWRTAPVPASGQPWFANAVIGATTAMSVAGTMAALHAVEHQFGRVRNFRNEPRVLDLDLLDYEGVVSRPGMWPELPHPRMTSRAFVLRPLAQVAPEWVEPGSGRGIGALLALLDPAEAVEDSGARL